MKFIMSSRYFLFLGVVFWGGTCFCMKKNQDVGRHEGKLTAACYFEKNKFVTAATDNKLYIWSLYKKGWIQSFQYKTHKPKCIVNAGAEGSTIVSGGIDGSIRIIPDKGVVIKKKYI